jgi:hypothetical protein
MSRTVTIALAACTIVSFIAIPARADLFTHHLDDAIAALESRRSPGPPRGRGQRALAKALRLVAKPHDRLSQDLKTGAKICILVARDRPGDRALFDIIENGLIAMEAEVVINLEGASVLLADSDLPARKRARLSAKIARRRRRADATTDPAQRAKRFAKVQKLVEKLHEEHG